MPTVQQMAKASKAGITGISLCFMQPWQQAPVSMLAGKSEIKDRRHRGFMVNKECLDTPSPQA